MNNAKIIYKNNKNRRQIFEALSIRKKTAVNKIAFNTGIIILNIFNNDTQHLF